MEVGQPYVEFTQKVFLIYLLLENLAIFNFSNESMN